HGVGNQDIGLTRMVKISVPIAPTIEQAKINQLINDFMLAASKVEQVVHDLLLKLDQIEKSILSKAFKGELVEQDPTEEPASALLERIQKEREKEKAKVKQTGSKKLKK
ncbi:MAG: specificity determinant for hsdM and hsdR, partial [Pseudanabaena sp.]